MGVKTALADRYSMGQQPKPKADASASSSMASSSSVMNAAEVKPAFVDASVSSPAGTSSTYDPLRSFLTNLLRSSSSAAAAEHGTSGLQSDRRKQRKRQGRRCLLRQSDLTEEVNTTAGSLLLVSDNARSNQTRETIEKRRLDILRRHKSQPSDGSLSISLSPSTLSRRHSQGNTTLKYMVKRPSKQRRPVSIDADRRESRWQSGEGDVSTVSSVPSSCSSGSAFHPGPASASSVDSSTAAQSLGGQPVRNRMSWPSVSVTDSTSYNQSFSYGEAELIHSKNVSNDSYASEERRRVVRQALSFHDMLSDCGSSHRDSAPKCARRRGSILTSKLDCADVSSPTLLPPSASSTASDTDTCTSPLRRCRSMLVSTETLMLPLNDEDIGNDTKGSSRSKCGTSHSGAVEHDDQGFGKTRHYLRSKHRRRSRRQKPV